MKNGFRRYVSPWAVVAIIALAGAAAYAQQASARLDYPQTRKSDHVDTYHGVQVPDPYRWLEDDNSAETAAWVEAQNKVTFGYLERIPYRAALKARLEALYNYPKYSAPSRKGDYFFFSKNDGLQNQSVLYIQKGLTGTPEVLIDPNTWSADGTSRLAAFSLSKDGKYAVVGISRAGSDWQEYGVMEVATKKMLPDKLEWVKVSGASWRGDGFFYSRYPAPAKGKELSSANENHQVYFHKVGTPQSADELVFQDPANPQRFHTVGTTEDERFAILNVSDRGKGKKGNALFVRDLSKNETAFRPLIGDDRRRHVRRHRQRRRQAAGPDRPRRAERQGGADRSRATRPRRTGRRSCPSGPSRCRAPARRAASCSSPI